MRRDKAGVDREGAVIGIEPQIAAAEIPGCDRVKGDGVIRDQIKLAIKVPDIDFRHGADAGVIEFKGSIPMGCPATATIFGALPDHPHPPVFRR
jgi:hypothetical protein